MSANFLGREQIGNAEIFFRGIRIQDKRIVRLAEKTSILPVREIAAGWSHDFGKDDVGG